MPISVQGEEFSLRIALIKNDWYVCSLRFLHRGLPRGVSGTRKHRLNGWYTQTMESWKRVDNGCDSFCQKLLRHSSIVCCENRCTPNTRTRAVSVRPVTGRAGSFKMFLPKSGRILHVAVERLQQVGYRELSFLRGTRFF